MKVAEKRVSEEVAIGQAAMGGSLAGTAPISRVMLASFGKMPTTSARRLTSLLRRSSGLVTGMKIAVPTRSAGIGYFPAYGATIRDAGHREHASGQADALDEPRARVSS